MRNFDFALTGKEKEIECGEKDSNNIQTIGCGTIGIQKQVSYYSSNGYMNVTYLCSDCFHKYPKRFDQ